MTNKCGTRFKAPRDSHTKRQNLNKNRNLSQKLKRSKKKNLKSPASLLIINQSKRNKKKKNKKN